MALLVPDESLATLLEANAYHMKRGSDAWSALADPRKEQLLRLAYDYLHAEFSAQWPKGTDSGPIRFGFLADNVTLAPGAVAASCLLALIAKDGELDPEITPQEIESEVGPLKSKYAQALNGGRRIFPAVVRLMTPYLAISTANPFSVKLVRA